MRILRIGAVCLLLAVSVAVGQSARAEGERSLEVPALKIGVGSKNGFFFLPTMVAEGLGYYKDEGLDVQVIDLGSGAKALEALIGGSVDVISDSYDHVVQIKAKGIALTAFVLQGRLPDYGIGLVKEKAAAYKSPQDLKGLHLGISSPGAGSDMFLKLFLRKSGIDPKDVPTVSVGLGAGAIAAIRSGRLDGIANNDPVIGTLEASGDIAIIADSRTTEGATKIYGGAYPAAALIAHTRFVEKNPKTTQALTNAMVRTLRWMSQSTPEQIMAVMPREFSGGNAELTRKILKQLAPTYSSDGLFPEDSGTLAYDALSHYLPNMEKTKNQLGDTFTNKFVTAAKHYDTSSR